MPKRKERNILHEEVKFPIHEIRRVGVPKTRGLLVTNKDSGVN